jgi:small-conductance mechanosensitive channel
MHLPQPDWLKENVTWLNFEWLGNTGADYVIALGVFLLGLLVFKIFSRVAIKKLEKASLKTTTDIDDFAIELIQSVKPPFYFLISAYLALQILTLSSLVSKITFGVFLLVVVIQAIVALQKVIDYAVRKVFLKEDQEDEEKKDKAAKDKEAVIKLSAQILKALLWVIGALMVMANMGIDVGSLVAGLGIGGIAIALALQTVLGDMFASFSIFTDKPFKVGDFIVIGNDMGTVTKVGVKTTRLKTLQGEELVVSNKDLTSARIKNYKKMKRRRISFQFGVTYDTPQKKVAKIPKMVEEIAEKVENLTLDRVHFAQFGDSALLFEVVYFMETSEYAKYMDAQQELNLGMMKRFEKEGIEFAYPTQTLYVKK